MNTYYNALLAILTLCTFLPLHANSLYKELEGIANQCTAEIISDEIPGAAVSIVIDNQIVLEKGYGNKVSKTDDPVLADTLFRTGSIQKMMTAAAVLSMRDQQRLQISDSIQRLIPDAKFIQTWGKKNQQITIENLLNHTSGIPDYTDFSCGGDDNTLSNWVTGLKGSHTLAKPGAFFNYTNGGYSYAGLVAERAAGMPYHRVMQESIWAPSGMHNTLLDIEKAVDYQNTSYGHVTMANGNIQSLPIDTYDCKTSAPAGLAFTTAGDMARWSIMLMSDGSNVISKASADAILTPNIDTQSLDDSLYGYGTFINDIETENGSIRIVEHSGSVPGWNSQLIMIPETGASVTALTNGDNGAASIAACITFASLNINPIEPEPVQIKPKKWKKYQGLYMVKYADGDFLPAVIYLENNNLYVNALIDNNEWVQFEAIAIDNKNFILTAEGSESINGFRIISFVRANNNRKTRSSTLWVKDRDFVGRRIFKF